MKKEVYLTILYDYYGDLLTLTQQTYFMNYYFDNLSLGEIAESFNVSRNAIHKQLKTSEAKLLEYEDKLKLYEKDQKLEQIISSISDKKIIKLLEEIKNN